MGAKPIAGWYVVEYRMANGICEKTKFYVSEGKRSAYSVREAKRQIRREEKNITEAKHNAARIVNHNFQAGRDYLLTLTLDKAGMEFVEMKAGTTQADDPDAVLIAMRHEMDLLIRRTHNVCRKDGTELRYWAVASDLNGKTGEMTRPHLHIIVGEAAAQKMADAWKLGEIKSMKKLWSANHGDLTDLVEYLLSQVRQIGTEKRYKPSRNLETPRPTTPRPVKNIDAPLRVPKGCDFIWRSEQRAGRPQKLRYYRPPRIAAIPVETETRQEVQGNDGYI